MFWIYWLIHGRSWVTIDVIFFKRIVASHLEHCQYNYFQVTIRVSEKHMVAWHNVCSLCIIASGTRRTPTTKGTRYCDTMRRYQWSMIECSSISSDIIAGPCFINQTDVIRPPFYYTNPQHDWSYVSICQWYSNELLGNVNTKQTSTNCFARDYGMWRFFE